MIKTTSGLSFVTAMLMLGTSTTAFALEPTEFADRLVATAKAMGLSFTYGSATAEGDSVVLSDFTFRIPGEEPLEVPAEMIFEGVVETADGGYTVERATLADVDYTDEEEGIVLNFVDIGIEGIELPARVDPNDIIAIGASLYDRMAAGPLTVTDLEGNELFAVELMEVTMDEPAADGSLTSRYQVAGIRADLTAIPDPEASKVIDAFGIGQLSAAMSGEGTWWADSGKLTIDDISFVVDNLGSISMTFAANGYTEAFYREAMKVNLKMAEMAEAGEEIDEDQMEEMSQAMLAMMSDLELVSGSLRYDDDSLFMKILDFIGAEQGVDGETLKAGLQFMVPMALAEVQDAEFKSMVNTAVNAFVADPQNFTISAEPSEPIAFSTFEERADEIEADPFVLVNLLNLKIRANQ